jgi:hypothetical protein
VGRQNKGISGFASLSNSGISDDAGEEEAYADDEADNRLRDRRDDPELEIRMRIPGNASELLIQLREVQLHSEDGWEPLSGDDGNSFLANLITGVDRLAGADGTRRLSQGRARHGELIRSVGV